MPPIGSLLGLSQLACEAATPPSVAINWNEAVDNACNIQSTHSKWALRVSTSA